MPKEWSVTDLGMLGELLRGVSYTKTDASSEYAEGRTAILRANNISNGVLNFEDLVYIPSELIQNKQIIKKNDIVICMSSGSKSLVGKSAISTMDLEYAFGAFCGLFRIESEINSAFVAYAMSSLAYRNHIENLTKGTNINNLKQNHIYSFPMPLPPLAEQHRIVAKIDTLFSALDKGVETLQTVRQQLRMYRQAVLKWAFDREAYEKKTMKSISTAFGGAAFKSGDFLSDGKYQVIKIGNVRPGVIRLWEKPAFIDNIEGYERYLLQKGDVIITLTGTRKKRDYGFTAIVAHNSLLLNQRVAAIRFSKDYLPKFFMYYSWTKTFQDDFFADETGNVGQGNVGMKAITETLVPCCSLGEQARIVAEIESRLSVCDKLEQIVDENLSKAQALKQSILKKAFAGLLVSQDPNDEPAEKLLERIKAEKKQNAAKTKGGKKNG